jgi:hypothetical protein
MYSTFNCAHGRLKGVCHEMNIFSEGLKNHYFLCPSFIKKSKAKFVHASSSQNLFSNPLQRPYSGAFDPENAYRKPPVILKIVPKACNGLRTEENLLIVEKQRGKSIIGREEKLRL